MRRILVAGLAAMLLLVSTTPALAGYKAENCYTYQDGNGHDAKMCVIVNVHTVYQWRQGLIVFHVGDYQCAWLDYIELYQGGVLKEHLNGQSGCYYSYTFHNAEQTDWNQSCPDSGDYQAKAYFKIKWSNAAGDSSTWKTLYSNHYITSAC